MKQSLPHETVMVSTKSHKLQDGTDYYGINPLGYVPFLVLDNGDTLHEGPAIVQYLADLAPEKNLAPANGTVALPPAGMAEPSAPRCTRASAPCSAPQRPKTSSLCCAAICSSA
jgi:hypothetical protein